MKCAEKPERTLSSAQQNKHKHRTQHQITDQQQQNHCLRTDSSLIHRVGGPSMHFTGTKSKILMLLKHIPSSHGGFLTFTVYHRRETIESN